MRRACLVFGVQPLVIISTKVKLFWLPCSSSWRAGRERNSIFARILKYWVQDTSARIFMFRIPFVFQLQHFPKAHGRGHDNSYKERKPRKCDHKLIRFLLNDSGFILFQVPKNPVDLFASRTGGAS